MSIFSDASKLKLTFVKERNHSKVTPSLSLTGSETDIVAFVSNKAVLVTISSHCVVESAASPSLTI